MCNKPFLVHMVAYGINVAVFSAVGTYLNQYTLSYFPVSTYFFSSICLVRVDYFVRTVRRMQERWDY